MTQDSATILLIREQILSRDYLRYAYYLSPSYKKPAVVLYHLARLLEKNNIPLLDTCRSIVKKDIEKELQKKNGYMDQLILSTALIRLDGDPPPVTNNQLKKNELDTYVFFRANLFSTFARPSVRFISHTQLLDCNFYCKAYCLALLTEYEILKYGKSLH